MTSKAWLLAAVGGSMLATGVHAQTRPPAPASATPDTAPLIGEVVVTAERREQKLESVSVAVSAFTAKERALLGIESVQDLTNYTPGLAYNSATNRAVIRGVGRNTDNLAVESAVAVYINDVYDGANAATILQEDDLFYDRIEVERGPQNTLHGSNSDGGTINYYSRRPTKAFYAEARAGVANFGKDYGEALMSGPVSDRVRVLFGGNYTNQTGGYFNNLDGRRQGGSIAQNNSGNSHYIEAQIEANVTDRLDAWAMASTGDFSANYHTSATLGSIPAYEFFNGSFTPSGYYGLCALPGGGSLTGCSTAITGQVVVPGSVVTDRVTALGFPGNNPSNVDARQFINEFNSTNRQRNDLALSTKWSYHFPGADLTYIGGFQSFNYDLNFDADNSGSGVLGYKLQAPTTANPLCLLVYGAANPGGCTQNLTVNGEPSSTYFVENERYFSHELDLTSSTKGPFDWIVGLYWYHEHYDQPVNAGQQPLQTQLAAPYFLGPLSFVPGLCPAGTLICPAPANPFSAVSTSDTKLTYDSYAGFAQGDWKFTDQLKATLGVRYTTDTKTGEQFWRFESFDNTSIFTVNTFGANTPALDLTALAIGNSATTRYPGVGLATYNAATGFWRRGIDATWSAWTGNAGLDWTPDPTLLAYAKYSRGYKTGGFNTFTLVDNPETKPEYVDAFEIGAKKTYGRTFQLNVAAFYYDYQNDQIPLNVQNASGLISSQLFNLPKVVTYGVELEGYWSPIEPLTLSLQYSHLSATISNPGGCIEDTVDPLASQPGANTSGCTLAAPGAAQAQNIKGQTLPQSTPNKVSLNALYRWRFEPGNLVLSGTFIWKDATYGSVFNRGYDLAPSYTQVDTRLTWTDIANRYTVFVYCANLFDKTGYDGTGGSELAPAGQPQVIVTNPSLTAPRTFGIEFQYRFK